jgi:membrane-associated HD superfamily phosphohydrolase
MENLYINHLAVFVCAILNLVLGAFWYSPPLFYRAWLRETNLSEEQLARSSPAMIYGLAFLFALAISYNLAFFLGDSQTTPVWGATAGFLAGFGWSTLIFAIIALFERRAWKYILINGGYITVYFTLIGFILGVWR